MRSLRLSSCESLEEAFGETSNQFDLLADVLSRDGNAIMSMEWFAKLYEDQLGEIDNEVDAMRSPLKTESRVWLQSA